MAVQADAQALKGKHRATWAAGDYATVSQFVQSVGPLLVERVGVASGMRVLDVATGSGNAAIPAAAAGADVIGLDLTPELFDAARLSAAEAGVEVDWVEGDAEDLPFDDDHFDIVLSTFGVQFAPRHELTAREAARVCRPGGVIGLCNWTPEGFIGQFLKTTARRMPPPPDFASPPPLWGSEQHVEGLFAGTGVTLTFERTTVDFERESPPEYIDFMAARYGPLVKARESLTESGGWEELRDELVGLSEAANAATDGSFRTPCEYLVVTGTKSG